jgi:hypothetical protein
MMVPNQPVAADLQERTSRNGSIAKKRHFARLREQSLIWGLMLTAAAVSYPLQRALKTTNVLECREAKFTDYDCLVSPFLLFSVLLIGLLTSVWSYHWTRYFRNANRRWNSAIGAAMAGDHPDKVVEGYTSLFDAYVTTKRRSYHLLSLGMIGICYAIAGVAAGYGLNYSAALKAIYAAIALLELICGLMLVRLSYQLSTSYLPGEILVRQMAIITTKMNFAAIQPGELDARVSRVVQQFEDDKPWYFYNRKGERMSK